MGENDQSFLKHEYQPGTFRHFLSTPASHRSVPDLHLPAEFGTLQSDPSYWISLNPSAQLHHVVRYKTEAKNHYKS